MESQAEQVAEARLADFPWRTFGGIAVGAFGSGALLGGLVAMSFFFGDEWRMLAAAAPAVVLPIAGLVRAWHSARRAVPAWLRKYAGEVAYAERIECRMQAGLRLSPDRPPHPAGITPPAP